MTHEIDPKLLEKVDEEYGKDDPVLYLVAFTKQGKYLIFNRSGRGIDNYRNEEDPLRDVSESEF